MKLRNKKTGEIKDAADVIIENMNKNGSTLRAISINEIKEEWEDYEEPKEYWFVNDLDGTPMKCELRNSSYRDFAVWIEKRKQIGNYFETKEEAKKAVEKLKAWKRLKDKNFQFNGYSALGCGEITFSLDFEDIDDEAEIGQLRHDLNLLFGGDNG